VIEDDLEFLGIICKAVLPIHERNVSQVRPSTICCSN
jgi:hypothetical protein